MLCMLCRRLAACLANTSLPTPGSFQKLPIVRILCIGNGALRPHKQLFNSSASGRCGSVQVAATCLLRHGCHSLGSRRRNITFKPESEHHYCLPNVA